MKLQSLIAATVVLALAAAPAFAQKKHTGKKKVADDSTFVTKAAKGGMAEVELGKLATEKGSSDQVKQFGQRMVDDHSKANDELKTIAQQKNMTLPTEIGAKEKALRDRLTKLSGAAFDRAYMQAMLADHRTDVNEFRMESRSGTDTDIKGFATKTLPTLEEHLKMAQDTTKAVGTSGTMPKR
jgi:putative membrane protein